MRTARLCGRFGATGAAMRVCIASTCVASLRVFGVARPVTPEVAGSSPVAPVKNILQICGRQERKYWPIPLRSRKRIDARRLTPHRGGAEARPVLQSLAFRVRRLVRKAGAFVERPGGYVVSLVLRLRAEPRALAPGNRQLLEIRAPLAGCRHINHGRAQAECSGRSWRSGAGTKRGHEGLAWPRLGEAPRTPA